MVMGRIISNPLSGTKGVFLSGNDQFFVESRKAPLSKLWRFLCPAMAVAASVLRSSGCRCDISFFYDNKAHCLGVNLAENGLCSHSKDDEQEFERVIHAVQSLDNGLGVAVESSRQEPTAWRS
jgi:hypothetical protein